MLRTGIGFDVHRLSHKGKMILGGVEIPGAPGIEAHSDGDVLCHAVCDALLGAAALGDIGEHFPDTDPEWKNYPGTAFLEKVREILAHSNFKVHNIDATIILEEPKISKYKKDMIRNIATVLNIAPAQVSVKATTSEKMGFTGEGRGIAALATALVRQD